MAFETSAADLPCDAIFITLRCSAKLIRPILLLFEWLIISGVQSGSPAPMHIYRAALPAVPAAQPIAAKKAIAIQSCESVSLFMAIATAI
jgi:hypothetical protein